MTEAPSSSATAQATECRGDAQKPHFVEGVLAIVEGRNTVTCKGADQVVIEVNLQWQPPKSKNWVDIRRVVAGMAPNSTKTIAAEHFCEGPIPTRYGTTGSIYVPGGRGFSRPSDSVLVNCAYFPNKS
ncbi:MAG: hypothetical protein ACT4QF_18680 [Sporichthyaceae bacterium]